MCSETKVFRLHLFLKALPLIFMIVKNYGAYFDFNDIRNKIKQIEMVSAIGELRVEELKSADNFIFD